MWQSEQKVGLGLENSEAVAETFTDSGRRAKDKDLFIKIDNHHLYGLRKSMRSSVIVSCH